MAKIGDLLSGESKDQIEKKFGYKSPQEKKVKSSPRISFREHAAPPPRPIVNKKPAVTKRSKQVENKTEENKINKGLEIAREYPRIFSKKEIEVLNKHFSYCENLIIKGLPPRDHTDKHLIKVCRGELPADTKLEIIYLKYLKAAGKYPVSRVMDEDNSEEMKRRRELGQAAYDLDRKGQKAGIPEVEEGYPKDEFGSREDHKKMRSRDYADMKQRSRG